MKTMRKMAVALASCAVFSAFAGTIPAGYVTSGLTAYWDAIDNQGTGTHDASATTWVDLVGQQVFRLTGTTWGDKYLHFAGTSTSYGALTGDVGLAIFDCSQTASKKVTVELVFKYDDTTTAEGMILEAQSSSSVAIGRMFYGLVMYYASGHDDWTALLADPKDGFYTVAVSYVSVNNVSWVSKDAYHNGSVPTYWNTRQSSGANDSQVTLGMTTDGHSCFPGRLYAVRVYDRKLDETEAKQNYQADLLRYSYEPAGMVVSGSVEVGGMTFSAGETVLIDLGSATLAIDHATDATLALDARIAGLVLADGALALANNASRTLPRLDSLTVGATAVLQLPSDGLYVTGTLTAEEGATVKGPGLLIGTAAQCPAGLTLSDGATYLCATATSFAWPSSGVAYVPAGMTADITAGDVAKVAGLDKIVFLDATSKASYRLADDWTFGVPLEGPGEFVVESAGKVTLTGDNRNLTGGFFLTNTSVMVASRYALGSAETKACTVHFGDQIAALKFSGAGLTNDVPLQVYQGTQNQNLVLGPDDADETLVLNGGFLVMDNANVSLYLRHRIRIGGGIFGVQSKTWQYVYAQTDPAELWFDRDSRMRGDKMLFFGNLQMHVDWQESEHVYFISLYTALGASSAPSMIFHGDNMLDLGYVTGGGTLDLNGHDQVVPTISRQYGSPLQVTSATPAVLKLSNDSPYVDDNIRLMNVRFSGAAGFDYAFLSTNELFGAYSDTTGPLTISKGALRATGTAGWGGTNVTVRAGARLVVSSDSAERMFGDRTVLGRPTTTHLAVERGGVLELEGGTATVRSYAYDGTCVPAGSYTSASGVGIEGAGALRVRWSSRHAPGMTILFR